LRKREGPQQQTIRRNAGKQKGGIRKKIKEEKKKRGKK